jgi:hypothetical protein
VELVATQILPLNNWSEVLKQKSLPAARAVPPRQVNKKTKTTTRINFSMSLI